MDFWEAAEGPDHEPPDHEPDEHEPDEHEAPGRETPGRGTAEARGSSGRGRFAAGTPEDVAALYTWANLQGARYRDFSASRRRYREQIRNQAAEAAAGSVTTGEGRRDAAPQAQPAKTQTQPAGPQAQPGRPQPAEQALEERRRGGSAIRWAAGRRGWDSSSRSVGREPVAHSEGQEFVNRPAPRFSESRAEAAALHRPVTREEYTAESSAQGRAPQDWRTHAEFAEVNAEVNDDPLYRASGDLLQDERWGAMEPDPAEVDRAVAHTLRGMEPERRRSSGSASVWVADPAEYEPEFDGPAWLYGGPREPVRSRTPMGTGLSRKSEVSRSPAEDEWTPPRETRATKPMGRKAPLLVLFSLAGGVGRTTLLATVGRALSAGGERVVLGDAAAFSLLPFYFGGHELRPGEVRGFAPPEGSTDAPVLMVNYDLERAGKDPNEQRHTVGEILRNGAECQRILLDIPPGSEWLLRRLATLEPTVLVPLLPDMSSVLSLDAVERYFERIEDEDGNPVRPFYLLNQYDAGQKLHRDVRELLRSRLGERLLSFVVRRSTAVSEALAEGMTVAEYAPDSAVTRDYFDVAAWLRTLSPPTMAGMRLARSGRG